MNINVRSWAALLGLSALLLAAHSCSDGKSDDSGPATKTPVTAPTAVKMKADFGLSATAGAPHRGMFTPAPKLSSCPSATTLTDGPAYAAGLNCDQDLGVIRYITPQSFKVALKRLTFIKDNGDPVDIIPDRGKLADSLVYDITSLVTITQQPLPAGTYASVRAELYYYEIKMPLNSNPEIIQSLRVYLSDDDFPSEGSLGHHQGDITFIDTNGNEQGWVNGGQEWTAALLNPSRGDVNGAGGTDLETGHLRGLFGDSGLWNQASFAQGANQDIFLVHAPLGLVISSSVGKTVTFTFNAEDSWFYEDFDGNQKFNPCEAASLDACDQNAEWAPIFNLPVITIE
jgi:hypothetical protein